MRIHVSRSLVQVHQVLLVTNPSGEIDCKRLDSFDGAYLGRLLVPVAHSTVSDAMTVIERDQGLVVDFEARLLLEQLGPFKHGVARPGV